MNEWNKWIENIFTPANTNKTILPILYINSDFKLQQLHVLWMFVISHTEWK